MRRQRTGSREYLQRRCPPPGIPRPVRLGRRTHRAWPRTPPATGPARSGIHAACGAPTTSHHAIGAGRCEAGVVLGVLQSANLGRGPVTFFACTFAPGGATEARIAEFFRKMARPAGFEPATPGLEGRCATQLSYGHVQNEMTLTGGQVRKARIIFCCLKRRRVGSLKTISDL